MYTNASIIVSGFFMNLISIVLSIYLIFQVMNKGNSDDKRKLCLAGLAFQMGFLIGPAMHTLMEVNPRLVIQALLYTATAFVSFSLLSLYSKRRSFLFLGGIIATVIQASLLYNLFSWITGYHMISYNNMVYLMFGLVMACLYIIYDTQLIIERAEMGEKDEIHHAMLLFIDLFDLFVRILKILIELNKREEENNRRKRRE